MDEQYLTKKGENFVFIMFKYTIKTVYKYVYCVQIYYLNCI